MANIMDKNNYEHGKKKLHHFAKHTDLVSMFPDCSTGHMSLADNTLLHDMARDDRDAGNNAFKIAPWVIGEYREGFFLLITVGEEENVFDKINSLPFSDSLKQVLHLLYDHFDESSARGSDGLVSISLRLDADGYEYPGIPTHEW